MYLQNIDKKKLTKNVITFFMPFDYDEKNISSNLKVLKIFTSISLNYFSKWYTTHFFNINSCSSLQPINNCIISSFCYEQIWQQLVNIVLWYSLKSSSIISGGL